MTDAAEEPVPGPPDDRAASVPRFTVELIAWVAAPTAPSWYRSSSPRRWLVSIN
ncbi:hypothetical protein OG762_07750 [Streptomyces sp. NBC_01136]|uniref:hypothetical protein n=1 Tax=unclassified Streptomyces TaxID=2593676 RepID=UPI003245737E|nr:hypothetical protein OG762_07750 [Streptomyces sp. NBC_01136]